MTDYEAPRPTPKETPKLKTRTETSPHTLTP